MAYQPRPIDSSSAVLCEELLGLTEQLAENAHEVWALRRQEEGWRLGPIRDDAKKEHPCLLPYRDLPESEKEYDRGTAMETLKAIVTMGYRIEPPGPVVTNQPDLPGSDESTSPGLMQILSDRGTDRATLLSLWRTPKEERRGWSVGPEIYSRFAERMLGSGEPLLAYDLVDEGLAAFPKNVRLRQLQGLALARSGDPERSERVLVTLRQEGNADEETLGLLARTYKDLGINSAGYNPAIARSYLQRSFEIYSEAHKRTGGIWTGINAATVALLLGEEDAAKSLAQGVYKKGLELLERAEAAGEDTYWPVATLGEASLIIGDLEESERWYARAAEDGWRRKKFGDINTTRRQARLLAGHRPGGEGIVERCFRSPRVAIFSGHMIDGPGRSLPRFPSEIEPAVREAIRRRLEGSGALIGYSSAACGSDILFLETLLELGGEAHVVLPYERTRFVKDSVEIRPGEGWGERFHRVLDRSEVITTSPQRFEIGGISYEFANTMAQGLATLRAEQLDGELLPMAVWDGRPGDGPGGTASVVERWREQGFQPDLIDLAEIASRQGFCSETPRVEVATAPNLEGIDTKADLGPQIVAILFADVVGFSKLTEEQIPRFVRHFLGLVAERLALLPRPPLKKNTWGDGLFFVFEDLQEAGRFALDLRDHVVGTRWEDRGLPSGLTMRIALHAGPVYECIDPVTEHLNCIGTHVSHAARIEPITPPGQVFASQAFAAMAAAEMIRDFRCHYVGQTPLAKGYGVYPTYHVYKINDHSTLK